MPVALAPVGMTGMQAPDGEIKAARAARTTAEAARRSRAAVAALRNEHGYSLTDSAALLGISRSRVIQLNREATDA